MIFDCKFVWLVDLQVGFDGLGNLFKYIVKIMGFLMEVLIYYFKLVIEGIWVLVGQVYVVVEFFCGEFGVYMVSDGGICFYWVYYWDFFFINLQFVVVMCEGGMVVDLIVVVVSIDLVMGGVDW